MATSAALSGHDLAGPRSALRSFTPTAPYSPVGIRSVTLAGVAIEALIGAHCGMDLHPEVVIGATEVC
jgi:hypothetical protein